MWQVCPGGGACGGESSTELSLFSEKRETEREKKKDERRKKEKGWARAEGPGPLYAL